MRQKLDSQVRTACVKTNVPSRTGNETKETSDLGALERREDVGWNGDNATSRVAREEVAVAAVDLAAGALLVGASSRDSDGGGDESEDRDKSELHGR